MKVFFLYPSAGSQLGFNYGVAHIAAVLRQAGHDVAFWQLCEDLAPLPKREQFTHAVRRENPDLLAFSVVTNQWPYTQALARWAKESFSIPLVIGGIHALVDTEGILRTGLFDYVFRGECEEAFLEFVDRLAAHRGVEDIRNLAYASNGQVRINPMRPLPDLANLPFKDYACMDFQKMIDAKHGWVGLMTSRGCPFSCTYCFNHVMVDAYKKDLHRNFRELHYIRREPFSQVMDEIRYLLTHYRNIRMFILDDDLFTFDKGYVREFCRAYREATALPFVVNAHVGFFDDETARELAAANCKIVKFGVESGSPRVRRRILNRHMSNKSIVEAIQTVHRHGMHSSVFIIIGFPRESREDVFETIDLLGRAKPGRFRWTFFFPYPATKAYQTSLDGGYINADKMRQLSNFTDDSCLDFGPAHNLFLKKVGKVMPWFVNAHSDLPVAAFYAEKVARLLDMDQTEWDAVSPGLGEEDARYSQTHCERHLSHYAIRYNRFMGVISDYFLNES